MTIVSELNKALTQLRAGLSRSEIAAAWNVGPPIDVQDGSQLIVVRSPPAPWQMIQVVGASDGELEVAFHLPDEQPAEVAELADAFGEPDVEDTFDGPQMLWFHPPDDPDHLIGASVRMGDRRAGITRSLTVVRTVGPAGHPERRRKSG